MNKTDAQEYAAELLEAAADGEWAGLLGTGLNAETIEAIRELNQLNLQITRWEERERVMHQGLIGRLQLLDFDDDPTTDGGDGPPASNVSDANRSQPLEGLEPPAQPAGANPSDTNGSARSVPTKPTGGNLMDLAVPT